MSRVDPSDETARLAAMHQFAILEGAPEPALEDLVRLTAQICRAPLAALAFVDADRQWFAARLGIEPRVAPRGALSDMALRQADIFEVPDTMVSAEFAPDPLVAGPPHARWYAGAPLRTREGFVLGALLVLDHNLRTLNADQRSGLQMLGRQAMALLESWCDVTKRKQVEAELQDSQLLLQLVLDNIPQAVCWKDRSSVFLGCNQRFAENIGLSEPAVIVGKTDYDLPAAEFADAFRADDQRVMASGIAKVNFEEPTVSDGSQGWLRTSKVPLRDRTGAIVGILVMFEDITARKLEEQEHARLKDDLIRAQASALAELSTPLFPISDNTVVMPLIGAIDSRRAQQVMEVLLEGIVETHTQVAILDITGVPMVDTQVADALIRAAQAVRLLGARVVLTGIRPEVAQTLVGLGVDLTGIVTHSTLQSGIAFALNRAVSAIH